MIIYEEKIILDKESIKSFESLIQFQLPDKYKKFISTNGVGLIESIAKITINNRPITIDMFFNKSEIYAGLEIVNGLFPFCGNLDGDVFFFDKKEKIYFLKNTEQQNKEELISSNFDQFL